LTGDRETAEDVVQETFLAAFRSIEKVDPRPSLSPWLNTIVLRTAGRAASRARSRAGSSLDQATRRETITGLSSDQSLAATLVDFDPGADPHASAEAAELRRDLAAAMVELPFKYRAAVVLRHVMGMEYAEAARELDLPLNTYKSHLLRGTKLLRDALVDHLEQTAAAAAPAGIPSAHLEPVVGAGNGNGRHRGVTVGSEQPLGR
jgi:RNA polymerase sigma-70 factor (ECF subfamily)